MYDHDQPPHVRDRHLIAGELVRRHEQVLLDRFGTAWEFLGGNAHATYTHSRFDVLPAAQELAGAHAGQLVQETVPLVPLAAIFHAHEGRCGDGGPAAVDELAKWPAFSEEDGTLLAAAIRCARPTHESWTAPSPVSIRLGAGVDAEAFAELTELDRLAAILADADRAHIGLRYGMHRTLLQIVAWHRDELQVPDRSDGSDLRPDPALVVERLLAAADAFASHRFVLAASERLFPHRDANVARIHAAVERLRDGAVTWPTLLQEAGWDGSKR